MDPVSMTFAAVGWLMSSLVNKVVTALLEAWAKSIGVENEFKTLKEQLLQLGALLASSHSLHTNNSSLKELLQNLQQLTYQAENLLDEMDYYRLEDEIQQKGTQEKVNSSKKLSVASSSSGFPLACHSILSPLKVMSCRSARDLLVSLPKTFSSRTNMSLRMKELAQQLKKSEKNVSSALNTELSVITAYKTEARKLRQTSSFLKVPRVFGRQQERDILMNLVTNEESSKVCEVPVLAIVGTVGVGKTTLARLVFNDPKVQRHFKVRFWIWVSTRFDAERLTREMLEVLCGKRYENLTNLDALQKKLERKLVSKRFLLVLDDMWEDKDKGQWDSMVAPLNDGIILVTTRNQSVAKMVNARDNIINLNGLDEASFLSFFSTCIFNDPNFGGNWRLRNVGAQIANKLKGNPLAAKTVGALLKEKPDEISWIKIRESEEWISLNGPDDIMPALRLSYEHMPFDLQRCFSYCAMLPEDHTFTCQELVYLWMAQGFLVVRSEGNNMEDIGKVYFDDLLNRGFFQTTQSEYDGSDCYTFHDLFHCFARMVSFKECLRISSGTKLRQIIPPTIRHLSIFNCTERGKEAIGRALGLLEGENLSTIVNWDKLPLGILQRISDLLKETQFLRAMRLTLRSQVQPHNLNFQNFVSLRYLRLITSDLNTRMTLPSEICRLYHLEVFEIEDGEIVELPKKFSDLVSLRHFIVKGKLHSEIWGVGKLTSLQELNHFNVQQRIGFEIEQLGSLKEIGGSLHIWNLQNVKSNREASKARLAEKDKLRALYLQWNNGEKENKSVLEGLEPSSNLKWLSIEGYGGEASPTWLEPSLIYLESLTLEGCKAWKLLPPLGELEFLKYLKLSGLATREIGPQCYGTSQRKKFRSLEELEIIDMPHLKLWKGCGQLQLFLLLRKLKIQHCTKLVDLPLSGCATSEVLERFPSLESLKIEDCPLIFQLPPLPYSSLLSFISIARSRYINKMVYQKARQGLSLILDQSSSLKMGELLAFHELRSLRFLEISHISSLEAFHELSTLHYLKISHITNLKFFHELSSLRYLEISHISSMKSFHELSSLHYLKISHITNLESFHDLSSLRILEISNITSLESLDLQSFVALENLVIRGCQSLTSLVFGEHLVSLKRLEIISCKTLCSMKGLKSWINLEELHFLECPGFIAAWDSASKEVQRTEPDFSLSLEIIESDSHALLTLPICNLLTSLRIFELEFSALREEHEVSLQLLISILVDMMGHKKFQSFSFDLFPSLKQLRISFPQIQSLPTNIHNEITKECLKLRNIKAVDISSHPVQIEFELSTEENICPADGCS